MESRFNHIDINNRKIHKIINAAFEVFSKNDLEKASTNNVVKLAGISRGLLYHYFKDKQELFDFLVFFSVKAIVVEMEEKIDWNDSDFLNRTRQATVLRFELMFKYPYMLDFFRKYEYRLKRADIRSQTKEIDPGFREKFYTYNINFDQLKEGTDTDKMIHVIKWTLRGVSQEFFDEIQSKNGTLDLKNVLDKYDEYIEFFRNQFYK